MGGMDGPAAAWVPWAQNGQVLRPGGVGMGHFMFRIGTVRKLILGLGG